MSKHKNESQISYSPKHKEFIVEIIEVVFSLPGLILQRIFRYPAEVSSTGISTKLLDQLTHSVLDKRSCSAKQKKRQ